jgi:hypothetical protein
LSSAAIRKRAAPLVPLCLLLYPAMAGGAALEPLHTQNLSPFTALLGLPRWDAAAATEAGWRLRLDMDLASHLAGSRAGGQTVILDGETVRTTVVARRRVGKAWVVGLEVPYVRHSGGFLVSFIDRWHDAFGLPDGGRDRRARDLLQFEYRSGGLVANQLSSDQSGLGDVTASVARGIGGAGLELHARLKLPTGEAERFTGSGGTDISLSLFQARPRPPGGRWHGLFWGAGVVRVDQGDLDQPTPKDWVAMGLLGSAFQLTPRVNLKTQLELHSGPYDSPLEELGDFSAQITFGASITVAEAVSLDLALSEDIVTSSAPDVAFHLGLVWGW